jgi:hypothetical protein
MRFNSSRSWETSKLRGLNGLRWVFGLSLAKRMTRGCAWDYNVKHYPLKPLNGQLHIVLGRLKGVGPLKHLGWLEVDPLKLWGHQKIVGPRTTWVIPIEILIELTMGIRYMRSLSQHGVGLALRPTKLALRPTKLALGVGPMVCSN